MHRKWWSLHLFHFYRNLERLYMCTYFSIEFPKLFKSNAVKLEKYRVRCIYKKKIVPNVKLIVTN